MSSITTSKRYSVIWISQGPLFHWFSFPDEHQTSLNTNSSDYPLSSNQGFREEIIYVCRKKDKYHILPTQIICSVV